MNMENAKMERLPREQVAEIVMPLLTALAKYSVRYEICGSWRRNKATCKDLDVLVCTNQSLEQLLIPVLAELNLGLQRWSGAMKVSFMLNGFPIDIKAVPEESWGTGLLHHTGNQFFNVKLRQAFKRANMLLNEYGVFTRETRERVASTPDEATVLRMVWTEPYVQKYLPPIFRELEKVW